MIFEALSCIQRQLNSKVPTDIANIADIIGGGAPNPDSDPDIIITLINIEENRISRDPRNYAISGPNIILKNPAVHLNLTLLFTAVQKSTTGYGASLQNLQNAIAFFQNKYVFDHSNTLPIDLDVRIEKLTLEMVSLNLEQLNNLWAILGSRYHPSVVYKLRMVTIDSVSPDQGSLVKEIESNYHSITQED